jgi:hypothetical protein
LTAPRPHPCLFLQDELDEALRKGLRNPVVQVAPLPHPPTPPLTSPFRVARRAFPRGARRRARRETRRRRRWRQVTTRTGDPAVLGDLELVSAGKAQRVLILPPEADPPAADADAAGGGSGGGALARQVRRAPGRRAHGAAG